VKSSSARVKGENVHHLEPGEWFRPGKQWLGKCCDCGLVHLWEMRINDNGEIELRTWRIDDPSVYASGAEVDSD